MRQLTISTLRRRLPPCLALVGVILCLGVVAGVAHAGSGEVPDADKSFDIHEYRVLGNTTLDVRDIERTLYPLLGDHKSVKDVEIARAALEKLYHDRGFATVFVDIPEQDIADETVRLKVTEGRLHEVHINGARYFSERKILAALPAATVGTVPNLPALQKQLDAVNVQTADRAVVPIVKAGAVPGTVDLTLKVDDHLPVHGSLELDNQNTPNTAALRSTASLAYADLFQNFDSVAVQYQVAPQDVRQVNVFAANYAWGVPAGSWHPSAYFINNNSNVAAIGTVGVIGKGQIYGARWAYPLVSAATDTQSVTLGVDYKRFRQTVVLSTQPAVNTPINYTNLTLAYAGSWSDGARLTSVGASANFGPRGVPNNSDGFAAKRFKGEANYFYVKLNATTDLALPAGFQLQLRADGQFAIEPLITNEQYSISGADAVRGYLEAEVLEDKGARGTVQLQAPELKRQALDLGNLFLFYDIGRALAIDPLPGEPAKTQLRSFGTGLHLLPAGPVTASLTWAFPLVNGPYTHRDDARFLFTIRGGF